ncbi:MAG: replication initiation protein, partial [Aquabacterium sp.]|nr:replication initiation protein [Aquabacterium sp.]
FKRDTLKPSIAEINAISDIDIELVEHKAGRAVGDIQFRITPKRQASLGLTRPPQPVDMELVARAQRLGIGEEVVESVIQEHGEPALRAALESLQRRSASSYPEPVRDPARYLRALLPAEVARLQRQAEEQGARAAEPAADTADAPERASREQQDKRRARWFAEWTRRQHEKCAAAIEALSPEGQKELERGLAAQLRERNAHPSIIKRLTTSGWQHPMVRHEMLKYFGAATFGERWDEPSAEQLLGVAAEMGEGG